MMHRSEPLPSPANARFALRELVGWPQPYPYVEMGEGVVIVPELPDSRVVLLEQYRPLVGRDCIELPAGAVERDEGPQEAASRELREELGIEPIQIEPLLSFYPSNGLTTERVHAFVARVRAPPPPRAAVGDDANAKWMVRTASQVRQMVLSGDIPGASSIIAISEWQARRF